MFSKQGTYHMPYVQSEIFTYIADVSKRSIAEENWEEHNETKLVEWFMTFHS